MIAGWIFGFVAAILNATLLFFSVIQLPHTLHIVAYHDYLGFVAIVGVALVMNIFFFRFYTHMLRGMVLVINGTVLLVIVSLLVRTSRKRSAKEVFGQFVNTTGWQSAGFVFLLGLLPGLICITAFNSAAHLTHEMPKLKVQTPQVMLCSTILGGLSGIPMALVVMFCVTNPEALLTPIGGQPFVQLLKDSLHSTSLSMLIGVLMVITLIMGAVAGLTTTSRVVWSMTADNLFIFQEWLAQLSEADQLPIHILVVVSILSCLIGLLQLGSATALNALAGAVVNCFMISYMIPIACVLFHKENPLPQGRYCRLGVSSRPVNFISFTWIIFVDIITCFPQYLPVTASNMKYTGPILAGVAILSKLNWALHARNHYQLPRALWN